MIFNRLYFMNPQTHKIKLFLLFISIFGMFQNTDAQHFFYNKMSVDFSVGENLIANPIKENIEFNLGNKPHINGSLRYMFNYKFGVSANIGYNFWIIDNASTRTINASANFVINIGGFFDQKNILKHLNALMYIGIGGSQMTNNKVPYNSDNDRFLNQNADEMLNINFGVRPMFKINESFSLFLDCNTSLVIKQNNTIDMTMGNKNESLLNGNLLNLDIGLSYYFPNKKYKKIKQRGVKIEHADWYQLK